MNNPIIFFDADCVLCSSFLQFLIRIDKKKLLRYSAINSKTYFNVINEKIISDLPDSVILYSDNTIFVKSQAIFEILKYIGGTWKLFYILKIVPKKLLDYFYDKISESRYKIFGKLKSCYLPPEEEKHLFLP